jgi:ATP-dependent DNA helicase RecG
VETPDRLIFSNMGSFLPGDVESVIRRDAPMEIYRNPNLVRVMVNLNMIDTQGGGIKRMFNTQMKRFFPMPDYDLSDIMRVIVSIRGAILDEQYTRLLMERTDLNLWAVILLDKIQKGIRLTSNEHQQLKKLGLVEGRYPNLHISAPVARATGQKAKHIRFRGLDRKYYLSLISELIREHGPVPREEIDRLLLDKLPEVLSADQKHTLINNLLSTLKKANLICNQGSRKFSKWVCQSEIV